MTRKGQRGPSVEPRRLNRRGLRLLVEPLESRALLSTASAAVEVMKPAISAISTASGSSVGANGVTNPSPVAQALTPTQIAKAYSLSLSSTSGAGTTIAIVDAYNDPNIRADLAAFDTQYGLAAASLTVVNQNGQTSNLPATDPNWSLEIAMDVEWAHVAAPGAKIVLVEANSATANDLMTAVQTAAGMANVVSMSWGGSEFQGETAYDTPAYFANPNVTFVAASGDDAGVNGPQWPASSPYVLSVGGTSLTPASPTQYRTEVGWSASGSNWTGYSGSSGGISAVESQPSYQAVALGSGYNAGRATPDVSFNADPNTGVSVYNSVTGAGQTGWFQVGGTSAGSPVWAGIVAAADSARAASRLAPLGSTQTLNLLYGLYGTATSRASTYASTFHDIGAGVNFAGWAVRGYDEVTGLGTPVVSNIVAAAARYGATTNVATAAAAVATPAVTVTAPRVSTQAQTAAVATPVTEAVVTVPTTAPLPVVVLSPAPAPPPSSPALTLSSSPSLSVSGAALASGAARPAQPLSEPVRASLLSTSDDEPVLPAVPDVPDVPGIFYDPVEVPEPGEVLPMLATRPPLSGPNPAWDAALDSVLTEERWVPAAGSIPPQALAPRTEDEDATPSKTALAGLAVAVWGTWEYRSRRSDRDRRRRWSPVRELADV